MDPYQDGAEAAKYDYRAMGAPMKNLTMSPYDYESHDFAAWRCGYVITWDKLEG